MHVGRAFLQTLAIQVAQSVLSIATGVIVARELGPAGQGVYATIAAVVIIGAAIGVLGQFQGIALVAADGLVAPRLLLLGSIAHSAAIFVIVLAGLPLFRPLLGSATTRGLSLMFGGLLALEVLAHLTRGINLGRHRVFAYNASALLQRVALLAGVLWLRARGHLDPAAVLAAWLGALALNILVSGVWIWLREIPLRVTGRSVLGAWLLVLGRGGRALVVLGLTLLLVRCDLLMLRSLRGLAEAGQMSIAAGLAEWLWYVPTMIANLLFAAVAVERSPVTIAKVARAARMIVLVSAPAAVVLMLIGRQLVGRLYGHEYAMAGSLFVFLVPGMLAIAVHLVVDSYFAASGFPPVTLWAAAGALAAKVLLNLALIPPYGAFGAAWSTSVVYAALLLVKVVWFRGATGTPLRRVLGPTTGDLAYAMAALRVMLRPATAGPPKPAGDPV